MAINTPIAFQSKKSTVSGTAQTLLDFGFTQPEINRANRAWVATHSQHAHILFDGNTPTASYGLSIDTNLTFVVDGNYNIQRLKVIHGGSDADVTIMLGE